MSIFAILMLASPATVAPTYLECTFPKNGAILNVTADEANSAVTTVLRSSGYTEKLPAAFTASEVRFEGDMIAYVVSRTDLSIRRTIKMLGSADQGTCLVQVPPKRAF
jgi:hypothetical protein